VSPENTREVSLFALGLRRKTRRDVIVAIIHGQSAGVAGSVADAVERTCAAEVLAVIVAVLADAGVVRVLADRAFRHAVWTITLVLTAHARCRRLTHTQPTNQMHPCGAQEAQSIKRQR